MNSEKPLVVQPEPRKKGRPGCQSFLFLLIIFACLASLFIVITVVQRDQLFGGAIRYSDADPDLNPLQRIFLLNYLNGRMDQLTQPSGSAPDTPFIIPAGATADQVINDLIEAGLLNDGQLFRNYLHFYGWDSFIQAGQFTLNGQLTIPELAATVTEGRLRDVTIHFLPGLRIEEMADVLSVHDVARIDPQEFLALARRQRRFDTSSYPFLNSLPEDGSLEGFLFPDTYLVPPDADAAYLIDQMLQNFDRQVTPAMRQAFGAQGLSLFQAVTLASIVAREALIEDERPLIASVYLNRVAQEMPLQADPTVQYAAGYQPANNSWWKVPLEINDLEYNHPYNTYVIPGLPPGPIANPGLSSLQAVAQPAQTNFLFFVLDCTAEQVGQHIFSQTYEEHLAYVQRCR